MLDPNRYRRTCEPIGKRLIEAHKAGLNLHQAVVQEAVGSHVPIWAIVAWCIQPQVLGELPVLMHLRESNIKFYKYSDIGVFNV